MNYWILSYVIVFLFITVFYHKIAEKDKNGEDWVLVALIVWFLSPLSFTVGVFCGSLLLTGFLVMSSAKKLNELMGRVQIKFVKGEDVPL